MFSSLMADVPPSFVCIVTHQSVYKARGASVEIPDPVSVVEATTAVQPVSDTVVIQRAHVMTTLVQRLSYRVGDGEVARTSLAIIEELV